MKRSNRVVHFEIPTDHPKKSIPLFKTIFGWRFEKYGDNDYWFALTGDKNEPGIDGAIMKKSPNQPMVNSIECCRY